MRKAKERPFKMVKVFTDDATPEQLKEWEREDEDREFSNLTMLAKLAPAGKEFERGLGVIAEFESMFPKDKALAEDGDWILVKQPPHTEYTVPPLSIWFAERWPMEYRRTLHRVKIVTPRGDLGLFPHEYAKIDKPEKYYEFIGQGIEIKFFGSEEGIPKDKLFYLRSRGVSKKDAIAMLLKCIRSPGICWLEASKDAAAVFGYDWPDDSRLATVRTGVAA